MISLRTLSSFIHRTLYYSFFRTPLLLFTWSRRILQLLPTGIRWFIAVLRLLFFTLLLLPVWLSVLPTYLFSSAIIKGVPYGPYLRNDCDIYIPPFSSSSTVSPSYPVLIFVPGGAWIIGYKLWGILIGLYYSLLCRTVLIVLDYRNYPQSCITGQIADIQLALNYFTAHYGANLRTYYGNPDYIYLMGQSAGAHLSMCAFIEQSIHHSTYGNRNTDSLNNYPYRMPIRRYFGIAGPYDVVAAAPHFATKGFGYNLLHTLFESDLERYSPNRYLESLLTILTQNKDYSIKNKDTGKSSVPSQIPSTGCAVSSVVVTGDRKNSLDAHECNDEVVTIGLRNRYTTTNTSTDKRQRSSTNPTVDTITLLSTPTIAKPSIELQGTTNFITPYCPHDLHHGCTPSENENPFLRNCSSNYDSVNVSFSNLSVSSTYPGPIDNDTEGIHTNRIIRSSSVASDSSLSFLPTPPRTHTGPTTSTTAQHYSRRPRQLSTASTFGIPSVVTNEASRIEADPELFEATAPVSSIVTVLHPTVSFVSSSVHPHHPSSDSVGSTTSVIDNDTNFYYTDGLSALESFTRCLPTAVHFFHGDADAVIPLQSSLSMGKVFQSLHSLGSASSVASSATSVHSMYEFMVRPMMVAVINDPKVSVHIEFGGTHTSSVLESLITIEPPSPIITLIDDLMYYDQYQYTRNKDTRIKDADRPSLLRLPLPLWYIRFAMWVNPF